ncbi:GNAT family N-acetyltransferase [Nocardioides panacihumi]|uniref:GNAT family N-acetyltransferase n=1 Tax=Nocardioides panacihumi TaxID=400774 RepID=A0ABN2RVL6_9ACTN
MSDVEVRDNPAENRYEAWLDGELAGIAVYGRSEHAIVFLHTEVDDKFEGKGVGSALARGALDDVRAEGQRDVVPLCPFIKAWIDKHPDYQDLLHKR